MDNVKLYDNALPEDLFVELQSAVMSKDFPWYYGGTAYMDKMEDSLFINTFAHNVLFNGRYLSNIAPLAEAACVKLAELSGHKIKVINRIRIALTTALPESLQHPPHIDMALPHTTGLLYLNDSDGDTYFYNEKYDLEKGQDTYKQYSEMKDKLTLMANITPKANRFIEFDGMHWHNSSTPTKVPRRLIVNYNYTV